MSQEAATWENRIVGHEDVDPRELQANPKNWRVHTERQRRALGAVMGGIGWVQSVLVNRQSGLIIDGHLRVESAIKNGEPTVPVDYVDLDQAQEAIALASLDPMRLLAEADTVLYGNLREEQNARYRALMDALTREEPEPAEHADLVIDHTVRFEEDDELDEDDADVIDTQEANPYAALAIRQIQFTFERDEYERLMAQIEQIMDDEGMDTNAEVVIWLTQEYGEIET